MGDKWGFCFDVSRHFCDAKTAKEAKEVFFFFFSFLFLPFSSKEVFVAALNRTSLVVLMRCILVPSLC